MNSEFSVSMAGSGCSLILLLVKPFLSSKVTRFGSFSNANTMYFPNGKISQVVTFFAGVCTAIALPE